MSNQDNFTMAMPTPVTPLPLPLPLPSTSSSPQPSTSAQLDSQQQQQQQQQLLPPPAPQQSPQPSSPQKEGKPRREGILLRESPACYRQVRDRRNPEEISGSKLRVRCIRFIATSSMMKCPTGEVNQERVFIKGDIVDAFVPPSTNLFIYEDDVWIVVTKSKKGPTKLWKRRFSEIKSCVDINFYEVHESFLDIIELGKVNRNPKIKQPSSNSNSSNSSLSLSSNSSNSSSSSSSSSWMPSVSFERGESLCFKVSPVSNKYLWIEAGLFSVFSAEGHDISTLFTSVIPPQFVMAGQANFSHSPPPRSLSNSGIMTPSVLTSHVAPSVSPTSTVLTPSVPVASLSPAPVTVTSLSGSVSVGDHNGNENGSCGHKGSVDYSTHSKALQEALLNLCEELLGSYGSYSVDENSHGENDGDDVRHDVINNE